MSVVGLDLGAANSVLAACRNKGVDVLSNKSSSRSNASVVGFGGEQRLLGDDGGIGRMRNHRTTVACVKRLIGRRYSDPEVQAELTRAPFAHCETEDGGVGLKTTNPEGEPVTYSMTAVMGMLLGHLRDTAGKALDNSDVRDIVVSIPGWFTQAQRSAMSDACAIGGMNCLRLMENHLATALAYGIYKKDLPDKAEMGASFKPQRVMFIDVGEADTTISIASLQKGSLVIDAVECLRNLGGRDFDDAIVDHFVEEFSAKYKLAIRDDVRAMLRMRAGCEKLKKIVNTVPEAPLSIECLMDDVDVAGRITREEVFELCQPIVDRIEAPLREVMRRAGIEKGTDLFSVEIVGGSSRFVPLRNKMQEVLGVENLSTTLNADESVARGCALQCAIQSPVFRVRDFALTGTVPYSVEFGWRAASAADAAAAASSGSSSSSSSSSSAAAAAAAAAAASAEELEEVVPVFPQLGADGKTPGTVPGGKKKAVTTFRESGVRFVARYAEDSTLPGGVEREIASFTVGSLPPLPANVVPTESGKRKVQAKLRTDISGVVHVSDLAVVDTVEEEVQVKKPVDPALVAAADAAKAAAVKARADATVAKTAADAATKAEAAAKEAAAAAGDGDEAMADAAADEKDGDAPSAADLQAKADEAAAAQTAAEEAAAAAVKAAEPEMETKLQKKTKTTPLTAVEAAAFRLSRADLQAAIELEGQLCAADRLIIETAEARNTVEDYVYTMRDKVAEGGSLHAFLEDSVRDAFLKSLQDTEDWLYGDGENQTKSVYTARYDELCKVGTPAARRAAEADERFDAANALRSAATAHKTWAETSSTDPKYDHITEDDRAKVTAEADRVIADLDARLAATDALPKHADPTITVEQIKSMTDNLQFFVNPIMNRPKPKPAPKAAEPAPAAAAAADAAPAADGDKPAADAGDDKPAADGDAKEDEVLPDAAPATGAQVEMDLD